MNKENLLYKMFTLFNRGLDMYLIGDIDLVVYMGYI